MNSELGLERCLSFIHCHLHPASAVLPSPTLAKRWRAVTISRQAGSGAHEVAQRLAERLQNETADGRPWTVFDRNLVERVLEDHHLPIRLARFMPEDAISGVEDAIDEIFGLHPASRTLVEASSETILRLAELGNVILIGRAANIITRKLDNVFHVRLVGSLGKRAERVQMRQRIGKEAALTIIQNEDRGRQRYLKKYFGKDIDDPLLYDLVINTDAIACDKAARMIATAL